MALIQCPECSKNISETADSCPKCGWRLTPEKVLAIKQKQKDQRLGCLVIAAIFIVLIIIVQLSTKNEPSNKEPPKPPNAVVANSPWDGSVSQVKDWLKEHLRDPDSLEFADWSPVVKTANGYRVRVKYRAKNGFGGYEVEERFFTLDEAGNVTDVSEPRPTF
jgi:hypothetical protein